MLARRRDACSEFAVTNTADANAAFAWHLDDHPLHDELPGPPLEDTVVSQCSDGQAFVAVAGAGVQTYRGPGSMVLFPAMAYHRTVQPKEAEQAQEEEAEQAQASASGRAHAALTPRAHATRASESQAPLTLLVHLQYGG